MFGAKEGAKQKKLNEILDIPTKPYPDVSLATAWLCDAFGFTVHQYIGRDHIQLNAGEGSVVVTRGEAVLGVGPSIMVRVADVNAHHASAEAAGARILQPPQDFPYGERQYTAADLVGHTWTFSQALADVDPANGMVG